MTVPENIRVLLIDDDLADCEMASRALGRSHHVTYEMTVARSLTEAEADLIANEHNVLLLDLGLPESFGMDTLVAVRKINGKIPIVILSDLEDEKTAMECLDQGAQDYLFKAQLELDTLSRSVRYAIQRQNQQEAIFRGNQLLEKQNADLARLCDTARRFVDNVSHEFRTPLSVITEYIALMLDGLVGTHELDSEQKRFLQILADRANDLNTMVDDMLDVSKLEAGLLNTWRKNCDLSVVFRSLRPALQTKAAVREVDLEFEIESGLPDVFCDIEKLGRVVVNLAVNAIKFCGHQGKVVISACSNPGQREVLVSVVDNGPGISVKDQKKIFDRFKQLGTVTESAQKGFGLGLSIANELVELNLGQLTLSSETGEGSTFSFTIPFADPLEVAIRYVNRLANHDKVDQVMLLQIQGPQEINDATKNELDAFLNYAFRPEDILFRHQDDQWLGIVPLGNLDPQQFIARIEDMRCENNRNRPGQPLPTLEHDCLGRWDSDDRKLLQQLEILIDQKRGICV